MKSITAQFFFKWPFRIGVKVGDTYEPIAKTLKNGGSVSIYPFECSRDILDSEKGSVLNGYYKTRLNVTLPIDDKDTDFSDRSFQTYFIEIADAFLDRFMLGCKTKGNQFWWPPVSLRMSPFEQTYQEVHFVDETGTVLYSERGFRGPPMTLGGGIDQAVWENVANEIDSDTHPSIVDYFLTLARTALFSPDIQLLVVNTAIALEIFLTRFCRDYNFEETERILNENERSSFCVRYLKKIALELFGKDFSVESKDDYEKIDFLFRTRNSIVHDGLCKYKTDAAVAVQVDHEKSIAFFQAALRVMSWINTFDKGIAKKIAFEGNFQP